MKSEQMTPYRSMLFVPGHKERWFETAAASGADALILDLEDAVPDEKKSEARKMVRIGTEQLRAEHPNIGLWVRPNSWETGLAGEDIEGVLNDAVDGLFLPKIYNEYDVFRFDVILEHVERKIGVPVGHTKLLLTLETAPAMAGCYDLAKSSPRVVSMLGATARDGDVSRALGYLQTPAGLETLYLRSRVVLACRAAGLEHPVCGLWQDIGNLVGLKDFARQNRELGYRGQVVLHPSHVEPVNDVFTPSVDEIEFYRGMVSAFEEAQRAGNGAILYEGQHIDAAHAKTAREVISRWERMSIMAANASREGR